MLSRNNLRGRRTPWKLIVWKIMKPSVFTFEAFSFYSRGERSTGVHVHVSIFKTSTCPLFVCFHLFTNDTLGRPPQLFPKLFLNEIIGPKNQLYKRIRKPGLHSLKMVCTNHGKIRDIIRNYFEFDLKIPLNALCKMSLKSTKQIIASLTWNHLENFCRAISSYFDKLGSVTCTVP